MQHSSFDRPLKGIGYCALGYSLFSIQDATVKWLVTDYAVPQILFTRSLIIILIACFIGRRGLPALRRTAVKGTVLIRAVLVLLAWLSYYGAARRLGLAELTTLYFAAPVIVVVLSVAVLNEKVDAARWLAVLVGFTGVMVAAGPSASAIGMTPAMMAFFAAFCWALGAIFARLINRSETTANQMVVSNALFAAACAVLLIWTWRTPDPFSLMLMLMLGLAGGLGQFFLYEGFRYAPASAIAPVEYTGLVWAFTYEFLIWKDVPRLNVFAGAALILGSSLCLIWFERRRAMRLALSVGQRV